MVTYSVRHEHGESTTLHQLVVQRSREETDHETVASFRCFEDAEQACALLNAQVERFRDVEYTLASALETFCETVENTGGVALGPKGGTFPVGDREWLDLGEAYVEACRVLGRPVKEDENG